MLSGLHGVMLLLLVGGVMWAVSYLSRPRRGGRGRGLSKDLPKGPREAPDSECLEDESLLTHLVTEHLTDHEQGHAH
ncbi:hypothetical protein GUITHDRAFT_152485 [Guillardia theta CCMP2712]|uniref:Uncharacterized protein n=1 Tax=Guillardia theta (strain CCMP2712) TaxID=905079 RepID=L1JDJ8_GUITC|nr:hypothetical protein GUITHDRAFT_152485 [Guillardia theta CCMP2712]EKX46357.1 hypothetical protein GUITHDRAFT_152485 [Guillardia theta CCMP2712]|eukprot:XP_005833337.1 hypothetical protein GUITHDRAFT_152485 [Guillardia theta CCMP2712]